MEENLITKNSVNESTPLISVSIENSEPKPVRGDPNKYSILLNTYFIAGMYIMTFGMIAIAVSGLLWGDYGKIIATGVLVFVLILLVLIAKKKETKK